MLTFQDHTSTIADVAAKRTKAAGWGGARPGSGRPRQVQDPMRLAVDFERPEFEALEALSRERDESLAVLVRRAVHAYLKRLGRV